MKPIKIEKNIPIPFGRGPTQFRYPFYLMEIGDSFVLPVKGYKTPETARTSMIAMARRFNKGNKNPIKLLTKKVIENNEQVIRVWRIK